MEIEGEGEVGGVEFQLIECIAACLMLPEVGGLEWHNRGNGGGDWLGLVIKGAQTGEA
jgi:hypothetical protein